MLTNDGQQIERTDGRRMDRSVDNRTNIDRWMHQQTQNHCGDGNRVLSLMVMTTMTTMAMAIAMMMTR